MEYCQDRTQRVEAAVETFELTRRFGDFTAVDAVSLRVDPAEIYGLIGPNGAGKTTLVKMLTTMLPPTSGSARVAGFDLATQAAEVRRHIGYVPQLLSADGELTGYENLLLSARLYLLPRAEREKRIADALALMGLTDVRDRLVRHYSGGMIHSGNHDGDGGNGIAPDGGQFFRCPRIRLLVPHRPNELTDNAGSRPVICGAQDCEQQLKRAHPRLIPR